MLTGFNETHLQIKKSVPAEPERYALLIKRREAPHFSGQMSSAFRKKVEKNKKWNLRSLINKGLEIPRVYCNVKEKKKQKSSYYNLNLIRLSTFQLNCNNCRTFSCGFDLSVFYSGYRFIIASPGFDFVALCKFCDLNFC